MRILYMVLRTIVLGVPLMLVGSFLAWSFANMGSPFGAFLTAIGSALVTAAILFIEYMEY